MAILSIPVATYFWYFERIGRWRLNKDRIARTVISGEDWHIMRVHREKKSYSRPEVKTRKIELGVFGNYGGGGDDDGPIPINVIRHDRLHME